MKRRLFTILSALSLLMCVAVCVLWVRSYTHIYRLERWAPAEERSAVDSTSLTCFQGSILIERLPAVPRGPHHYRASSRMATDGDAFIHGLRYSTNGLGFRFYFTYGQSIVIVPLGWVAVLAMAVPLWHVLLLYAGRRLRRVGLCPSCGYDLRATPGRCPECGLVPAAPPPPPTSRGNDQ